MSPYIPIRWLLTVALIATVAVSSPAQKTSFGTETGEYAVMLKRPQDIMLSYQ